MFDVTFMCNAVNTVNDYVFGSVLNIRDGASRTGRIGELERINYMAKSEACRNFYTFRIIDIWNNLSVEIRDVELDDNENNSKFKRYITEFLKDKLEHVFDDPETCKWLLHCRCSKCRVE